MGIGREVADAYIDVHGDLKSFRRDLEGARAAGEDAGVEAGDAFADGFAKRAERDMLKRWNGILDTLYDSGDKFDFSRLLGDFNLSTLDAAADRMRDTMAKFAEAGKMDLDDWIRADEVLQSQVESIRDVLQLEEQHGEAIAENTRLEKLHADALRENAKLKKLEQEQEREAANWRKIVADAEDAQHAEAIRINRQKNKEELDFQKAVAEAAKARHEEALRMNEEYNARRRKTFEEALAENEKWKRSFEGIRKMAEISGLNEDFKKLGSAMRDADISKFMKGFESFDEMRARVIAVTDAMRVQGRISEDNAATMRAQIDLWIQAREEEIRLEGEALDAARQLREAQERYRASLDGMVDAAHFKKVESDMRDLTDAIGTADFSKFGRGARTVQEFRDRVIESAFHLKAFGKIGADEFEDILRHLDKVSGNLKGFGVDLDTAGESTGRWNTKLGAASAIAGQLLSKMSGTVSHIKGLAGLNVLGDTIQRGLDIAKNIDRVALSISTSTLKIGSAASLIISAAGGLINVMGDLGSAVNIGWLAPGFFAAAGIQIGVLVAAFKDMKTVLKDLGPQFSALQDSISKNFWDQAEAPIRRLVDSLMPTLETQLGNTATSLGGLFKAFTDGFTKNATPARVEGMFKRMNRAIDIAQGAMEPLASAFVTLGEHASEYFGRFSEWIVQLSTDFDDFVTAAAKDGRLRQWTEDAINAFKDTGRAVGGVVEIFQGLNEAAEAAGIGGLKEFADSLERMADIAKSPEFQGPLTDYFKGAKAGADQIVEAIEQRLFPALGNIAPTMSTAMDVIGEAMGKAIGYVADIIENPRVQEGILALTNGINDAMTKLEPAIGPIGDSLGSLLEISGNIVGNIAEVFATFMVNFGPTIDAMGRKIEELADPLTGSVKNAMEELKPVIDNINTYVVVPLVDGLKKIAPEIDKFVDAAGPTLKNISDAVGPQIEKFLGTVLPNAVTFALEMGKTFLPFVQGLVELLTPAFGSALDTVGAGFKNAAEGLKALRGEANEFDLMPQFKQMHDKVDSDWRATWEKGGDNSFWEKLGHFLFGGNITDMGTRFMESWGGDFEKIFGDLGTRVGDGFQRVWKGEIFGDQPGKFFREFFSDEKQAEIDDTVNQWLEDLGTKIKEAWDGFWKSIFGGGEGEESGGGHFAGRSVGGKITAEDIGLGAPEENWLEATIEAVTTAVSDFFTGLQENFTTFMEPLTTGWNEFWGGFGTVVGDTWTNITTFLSEKWTEISTNIALWWEGIKTGWNEFWGSLPTKVNEVWTTVTTWITTKAGEIRTNIDTFIATVRTNWDNFWNTVNTKAQTIWTLITTWIQTKVGEIRTGIDTFITTVRTNWENFWNTVNTKAQTIWTTITSWIRSKVNEIKTNIDNLIRDVKTNWDTFWGNVRDTAKNWWDKILTAVQTGVTAIVNEAKDLPNKAVNAVPATIGLLTQKGRDFAQGFINGIGELVDDIASAAAAFVNAAITAAQAAQNSHSPSKVTLGLGHDYGDGYINGIAERVDGVKAMGEMMAGAAISALSTSRMYSAGAEAALGLADGLKSQGSLLEDTLTSLIPDVQASIAATGFGPAPLDGAPLPAGKTVVIEEGAIRVESKAQNNEIVASKVLDEIADIFDSSDA
ncbi:tape measure protein [Arthrobacter phage Beagle]|nr:tape measure protein [Arthrobacter phage Beagle]